MISSIFKFGELKNFDKNSYIYMYVYAYTNEV